MVVLDIMQVLVVEATMVVDPVMLVVVVVVDLAMLLTPQQQSHIHKVLNLVMVYLLFHGMQLVAQVNL